MRYVPLWHRTSPCLIFREAQTPGTLSPLPSHLAVRDVFKRNSLVTGFSYSSHASTKCRHSLKDLKLNTYNDSRIAFAPLVLRAKVWYCLKEVWRKYCLCCVLWALHPISHACSILKCSLGRTEMFPWFANFIFVPAGFLKLQHQEKFRLVSGRGEHRCYLHQSE